MTRRFLFPLITLLGLTAGSALAAVAQGAAPAAPADAEVLRQAVADTERAFARSMAERNFEAFQRFLSAEATFRGSKRSLRGPAELALSIQAAIKRWASVSTSLVPRGGICSVGVRALMRL